MPRPIRAVIDIRALRGNLERMREAARGRTLWAVVKADAYGHGLKHAVRAFSQADGLATLEVCDALEMRSLGWDKRILLLEGFFDEQDLALLGEHNIETVVHNHRQLELIAKRADRASIGVHIKINSGMNRLGFAPAQYDAVRRELASFGCRVLGTVTHFANAERSYPATGPLPARRQLENLGTLALNPDGCFANSAAILFQNEVKGEAVRAGVALYGMSPDSAVSREALGLAAGMRLEAEIIAVRNVPAGQCVGYGSRWCAERDSRIAVVACGYADGYPRSMPDGAPVFVCGRTAPLAGAVSMDMLTIDVTDIEEAAAGSVVELWGSHIEIDRLARLAGTIGYELMCRVAPRVPRVAVE